MAQFFDLSGFILGILGCGIFQILCSMFFDYLPKNRLKALEKAFEEAYTLFRCGVEEGLIRAEYNQLKEKLKDARRDLNDIRDGIVHFGTFWEQVQALFSNFSRKLDHVDRSIKALRKAIVSTSDKAKIELEARGYQYDPCMFPLEVTLLGARCHSTCTHTSVTTIDQLDDTTRNQVSSPCQSPQSTSSETPSTPIILPQPPSPSILFPSLRRHRDSISSVSTSSTAVATEEVDSLTRKPMLLSFRNPHDRNSVGAMITSMLLRNKLQSSVIYSEEPKTYADPSVPREHDMLQGCFDHLSPAMLQQYPDNTDASTFELPSISKTLLSKVPNPWSRTRSHLLPI